MSHAVAQTPMNGNTAPISILMASVPQNVDYEDRADHRSVCWTCSRQDYTRFMRIAVQEGQTIATLCPICAVTLQNDEMPPLAPVEGAAQPRPSLAETFGVVQAERVAREAAPVNGHGAHPQGITQTQPVLPEAACSVNLFFEVDGYGKGQATGLGRTPQEAAANLKATIQETRAALAPQAPGAPPTRQEQIGQMLAKGIACAVKNADMPLCERLSKAAFLVLSNAVEPGNEHDSVAVRSQSNPDSWYEVTHDVVCTCPDWGKHHSKEGGERYLCKHCLCAIMARRLGEVA